MAIIPLHSADDPHLVGGKAANLTRAVRLGFQVPDRFVLPRATLSGFMETHRLSSLIQVALDGYERLQWHERLKRFEALRNEVMRFPIPEAIKAEVEPRLLDLSRQSPHGVAVRSSGACEDLETASFAGIYESFLGISDVGGFWRCVLRCWCSTWSPQAAAYAAKMGISIPIDGMAVLVQSMIPAESAGVVFTADPLTGNPWCFVLNAAFGLASGLADGSAPADRITLAWDTAEVIEKSIQRKPTALIIQDGNVSQVPVPEHLQGTTSLTDNQAQEIGLLALAVDRAFDRRMDIEWAMAGDQIYLLQARPLTALPPFFPHQLTAEEAEETWIPLLNTYENMTRQEKLIAPLAQDRWSIQLWQRLLEPDDIFPRVNALERDFNGYRYETERKWSGNPSGYDQPAIEQWLISNETRLRQGWLDQLARVGQFNSWLDDWMPSDHTAAEWVRTYLAYTGVEMDMQAAGWYAPQWMVFNCGSLLNDIISRELAELEQVELAADLLLGLSCYSVERTIKAQDLGHSVQEEFVRTAFTRLPLLEVIPFLQLNHPDSGFLHAFGVFCRAYGLELPPPGTPRNPWALNLDGLLLVIKTSLLSQGAESRFVADTRSVLAAGAARRQATEERARSFLRARRPGQLERFNRLLDWAQFWTPALDNRKWGVALTTRGGELKRRTSQALVMEKLIDQPKHIHLLTRQQWAAYAQTTDADALVAQYRENLHEYEKNRRLVPLPFLGKAPQTGVAGQSDESQANSLVLTADTAPASRTIFQGEGIAPGRARGIAYKISSLDAPGAIDRLTNEHILICGRDGLNEQWRRDWYSLFMLARGLVTVQGAQLHHATQIARECGVPFINLPEETFENVPDGQWIEIDGQAGTLKLMN